MIFFSGFIYKSNICNVLQHDAKHNKTLLYKKIYQTNYVL